MYLLASLLIILSGLARFLYYWKKTSFEYIISLINIKMSEDLNNSRDDYFLTDEERIELKKSKIMQ